MTPAKKILIAALAIALAGLGGAIYRYRAAAVLDVETARATRRDLVQAVAAMGKIKARKSVSILPKRPGRVAEIYVEEGDFVEAGQRLAKLESAPVSAKLKVSETALKRLQAELEARSAAIAANEAGRHTQRADLERANADLQHARAGFERAEQLLREGLIARRAYEQQRADFTAATAAVEEAQARLQELAQQKEQLEAQRESTLQAIQKAQARLQRATSALKEHYAISPLEGVITHLHVRAGETPAAPGPLMEIGDLASMAAEVTVDGRVISDIAPGQKAQISIETSPDRVFEGRVIETGRIPVLGAAVASRVNIAIEQAAKFNVIIGLDELPPDIHPGMRCTARVTTAARRNVLTVPQEALTVRAPDDISEAQNAKTARAADESSNPDKQVRGVFIATGGRAAFRPVKSGIRSTGHVEIVDGLQEGEEIMTGIGQAGRRIQSGARVRVRTALGKPSRQMVDVK